MAETQRDPNLRTTTEGVGAWLSYVEGDWTTVRDYRSLVIHNPTFFLIVSAIRMLGEYQTGNFEQAHALLKQISLPSSYSRDRANVEDGVKLLSVAIASRIEDVEDELPAMETAARYILSEPKVTPFTVSLARAALANVLVNRGDVKGIANLYDDMRPLQGTLSGFGLGSFDRLLGGMAKAMGNLDDAQSHFEDALAFCRKAGFRPELAWSLCDYADMLLERNDDGDKEKATDMLDESLAISTELGMRPLMERVLSRREILKA